ncbi:MAG: hypothetical protein MO852_16035, partial [Candidatus Devosia euplotis]|nr:hypothetical protein [Candidatus Devosia euplotis]
TTDVTRWLGWYERCAQQYERWSKRPQLLEDDPNFGPVKPVAILRDRDRLCVPGMVEACADQRRVEVAAPFAAQIDLDPERVAAHAVVFYGLGLGPLPERFDGVGMWPLDGWRRIYPDLQAAACVAEIGGLQALDDVSSGRTAREALDKWEAQVEKTPFADFVLETSPLEREDVWRGLMIELYRLWGADTMANLFDVLATGPFAASLDDALCDLQNAMASALGRRVDAAFVDRWRWPDCRSTKVDVTTENQGYEMTWSWVPRRPAMDLRIKLMRYEFRGSSIEEEIRSGASRHRVDHALLCKEAMRLNGAGGTYTVQMTVAPRTTILNPATVRVPGVLDCRSM